MIEYLDNGKRALFGGLVFIRDDNTGYYLNSTLSLRLHRAVYEAVHGPIPAEYHVHHIDFDKANNEPGNLIALSREDHLKLHGAQLTDERLDDLRRNLMENAQPKAIAWHQSNEGREWHRKHYSEMKDALHKTTEMNCLHCGHLFKTRDNGCSKFCSNACKSAFRRASGVDNEIRQCAICGGEYSVNKYSKHICCSRECAARYRQAIRKSKAHNPNREDSACVQHGG